MSREDGCRVVGYAPIGHGAYRVRCDNTAELGKYVEVTFFQPRPDVTWTVVLDFWAKSPVKPAFQKATNMVIRLIRAG